MSAALPRSLGQPLARARLRVTAEDFLVDETLGFAPEGAGEHVFLRLEKRGLGSDELALMLAGCAGVAPRAIGYSGLKDRNALTTQWFSVHLPGRMAPPWGSLESDGRIRVLAEDRHPRKLRRGVHAANHFRLTLRELDCGPAGVPALEQRLHALRRQGVPNYFGEQRFGRANSNLHQARRWMGGGRRPSRARSSMLLSALRSAMFNDLLARRVQDGSWQTLAQGDVCMLQGTHSIFVADDDLAALNQRVQAGDVHLALPLPGTGTRREGEAARARQDAVLLQYKAELAFLEAQGVALAYRAGRVLPGDFSWHFCDDAGLRLAFTLAAGSYATALVAELVNYQTTYEREPD